MSALSDHIEQFIKELMAQSSEVSLQRNELAQQFSCAPSQINYVLSTRFTLDRGYVTVSRRGSGGYIRVTRVDCERNSLLHELACNRIKDQLEKAEANDMVDRLEMEHLIDDREGMLIRAALDCCAVLREPTQGNLRARMMRAMLSNLMQCPKEEE